MDLSFSAEEQKFRQDLRAFFAEERVQGVLRGLEGCKPRVEAHSQKIYQWLGERGWLAPNWPVEYGGAGKTAVEAAILSEEMARASVPDTVHVNTIEIVGLFLLLAGTDEQKKRFLPAMARGDTVVSVLYTEPNSGSDLSSLTTRAVFDGDGYLLYGTKIYSLTTQFAQYGLTATRTRGGMSKYDGITLFLVPLRERGVEIRPLWNISDERFNEVVLDGAWVSPENIVGPLHGAWELINTALSIERTGLDYYVKMRRWLDAIIARARETGRLEDPRLGHEIVRLDAQVEAGRLMVWDIITQLQRGELDNVQAAMSKWYNTEVGRHIARLGVDMEGLAGTLSRWDGEAPMGGLLEAAYRECPGLTISAGTSEIMLYVIAAVGLEIGD